MLSVPMHMRLKSFSSQPDRHLERVTSTHSLQELLQPVKTAQTSNGAACLRVAGLALMVGGISFLAGMLLLLSQICSSSTAAGDVDTVTSLPDTVYYSLVGPCTLPLGLAAVVWNWLSLKLFKHSVSPPFCSTPTA